MATREPVSTQRGHGEPAVVPRAPPLSPPPRHLSGAGRSHLLREVLHQHSDRSSVLSYAPVSWLCSPDLAFPTRWGAGAVGARHPQNLPRCIQLPPCSTGEAEPVLPLTQHAAAAAVEKGVVANPSDLARLPWHLCSSI